MAGVDRVIERRLDSGVPWSRVSSTSSRPAASDATGPLLLMAGALGYRGEQRFNLAAVVEFIHTATLLRRRRGPIDAAARPAHR
jgi:octaprenyl-diphosphate synthase